MSRMTVSIQHIKEQLDSISGLGGEAEDIIANSVEPLIKMITDYISVANDIDHLKELAEAEMFGRIIVLPAALGSTVYAAETEPVIPLTVKNVGVYLEGPDGGDWERLENFGKTIFLSADDAANKEGN